MRVVDLSKNHTLDVSMWLGAGSGGGAAFEARGGKLIDCINGCWMYLTNADAIKHDCGGKDGKRCYCSWTCILAVSFVGSACCPGSRHGTGTAQSTGDLTCRNHLSYKVLRINFCAGDLAWEDPQGRSPCKRTGERRVTGIEEFAVSEIETRMCRLL